MTTVKTPVYIIHPFKGTGNDYEENIARIKIICQIILNRFPNVMPISPVLTFNFLNDRDSKERTKALDCCAELLQIINRYGGEAWIFGNYIASEGCQKEVALAREIGMKLRYNLPLECDPLKLSCGRV